MKLSKLLCLILGSACFSLLADVKLPTIFSDNMILQRDSKVRVWGWADNGEKVTVTFGNQSVSTVAKDGKFLVELAPLKASAVGQKLVVKGKNIVEFDNVLVGDIYLCSGQSNMEWRLKNSQNGEEAVKNANYPAIRLYYGNTYKASLTPQSDIPNVKWEVCSPETAGRFSGVAYFFALEIYKELNVPIGLISANWGGSNIEPWISAYGFSTQASLRDRYNNLAKIIPGTPEYKQNQAKLVADMQKWIEESSKAIAANDYLPEIPTSIYETPRLTGSRQDSVLFNNMIAPYTKFAIKGALWYQGCANLSNGMAYRDKMHALVASWRKEFDMPEMPLYFVQLAPFTYGDKNLLPYFWTVQQRFADEDPYAKMAVINDIGDYRDIHPRNKHDVGHRLALLALKYTYGKKDLVADSPFFESLDRDGKDLIVTFRNATTLKTTDNNPAKYFEIAGIDRVFYPATVEIIGNKVKLSSDKVAEPYAARYAWNQNVTTTLVNENNLPAGTFYEKLDFPVRKNLDALVPEAKNMKVLYSLPISNIKEGNRIMYFEDNSAELAGKKIKKIGYFMYLKDAKDEKYVYATVDPFTQDVTKLGLPTAEAKVFFQQIVKNLTVKSNVPGVTNGTFADGNVEIWPSDYAMPNTAKVENASDKSYDFGDSGANANRNGYGSWQLHNFRNKEVIFALNHFTAPVTDVGIGNNPKGHLDYTFTNSSRQYNYGELLVLVDVE